MMSRLSSRSWKQRPSVRFGVPRAVTAAAVLVVALAALSACTTGGNSANTGQTSTSTATATTPPTATPKPKPTSVPTTSLPFCQGLLSLAEVNSIMSPAHPATSILYVNDTSSHLSGCSWTEGQTIAALFVFFVPFQAGTSIESAAQAQFAKLHVPPRVTLAHTPVSGVGDQALYFSLSVGTPGGLNYGADLVAADGGILLGCAQTGTGPVPTGLKSKLTQACTVVITRL